MNTEARRYSRQERQNIQDLEVRKRKRQKTKYIEDRRENIDVNSRRSLATGVEKTSYHVEIINF